MEIWKKMWVDFFSEQRVDKFCMLWVLCLARTNQRFEQPRPREGLRKKVDIFKCRPKVDHCDVVADISN